MSRSQRLEKHRVIGSDSGVLELYKLAVDQADKNTTRREANTTLFLTLHSNIVVLIFIGLISRTDFQVANSLIAFVPYLGLLFLCYLWNYRNMRFKELAYAKFKVIAKLEEMLPIKLYDLEWQYLIGRSGYYISTTQFHVFTPHIFGIFYTIFLTYFLINVHVVPINDQKDENQVLDKEQVNTDTLEREIEIIVKPQTDAMDSSTDHHLNKQAKP